MVLKILRKWVTDKVKEFLGKVVDGIKSVLGIKSPSKVFRDQIGKNMVLFTRR